MISSRYFLQYIVIYVYDVREHPLRGNIPYIQYIAMPVYDSMTVYNLLYHPAENAYRVGHDIISFCFVMGVFFISSEK